MKKRQFGKGRMAYASDFNLGQDYQEDNIQEFAQDAGYSGGFAEGGTVEADSPIGWNVVLKATTIGRDPYGDRMRITSDQDIDMEPSGDPGVGMEVYMSAFLSHTYTVSEEDTDSDGVIYYKDYADTFEITVTEGTPATTGNAVKPSIPADSICICDVLVTHAIYLAGQITVGDIDVSRQATFSQADANAIHINAVSEIDGLDEKLVPVVGDMLLIEDSADSYNKKKVDVGNMIGNDSDAIHDNVAGEIDAIAEKVTPVAGDWVLIEDSADSYNKKKVDIDNLLGGANDPNAVHVNQTGEIEALTEKVSPITGDYFIIEDSEDHYEKKKLDVGNLPGGADPTAVHTDGVGEIEALDAKSTTVSGDLIIIEDSEEHYEKKKVNISNVHGVVTGGILTSDTDTASQLVIKDLSAHIIGMFEYGTSSGLPATFSSINSSSNFISGRVFNAIWNDLAECFPSDGKCKENTLVQIDRKTFQAIPYDGDFDTCIGINSPNPGFIIGVNKEYKNMIFVALKGMVWLKCDSRKYQIGDNLFLTRKGIMNQIEIKDNNIHFLDCKKLGVIIEIGEFAVRLFI